MTGYVRPDGRKGIRNVIVVAYLVECAHHVAREIAAPFREQDVHLIGFGGCYPNDYASMMMARLCTHPNVGGAVLVSLGCESFPRASLENAIRESGRPVSTIVIQQNGGTRSSVDKGRRWIEQTLDAMANPPRAEMGVDELIIGAICGGSDATSGITGNPAVGRGCDRLVARNAACIFEETGELFGCEKVMAERAVTPELADELNAAMEKAARYYTFMGHGSFAVGNAEGGLTTQEEKSLGAYSKSGSCPISGLLKPGDVPPHGGMYLMDMIPDGDVRWGFPNVNDNAEIAELIACGSHLILFVTGRGSVVGSAISAVIKVCANPVTYRNMSDDMDVNAGRILEGRGTLDDVGQDIVDCIRQAAEGVPTKSEQLGHQEFVLTYKSFEPTGPGCLPPAT